MLVDINLLPQKERDRPASIIAALSILLLGVIVWGVFAFLANGLEKEQAALAAESAQVASEQALLREQLEATQGLNEEQQLKVTVDWAESYQFDTVPLLDELVSKLPQRGFFDSFAYTGMDQAVLAVQFDTAREAAYYLAQLKASEMLESATLDSVTQEELEVETAGTETDQPEASVINEDVPIHTPRYIATYTLIFVDGRLPALTPEGEVIAEPVDPAAPSAEQPASEAPAEDVEVDVEVNEEAPATPAEPAAPATTETPATPTTPEGTEGSGQ